MKRYVYDDTYTLVEEMDVTPYSSFPQNSTTVTPPVLAEGEFAVFSGSSWSVTTSKPEKVPREITMRQARLELMSQNLLPSVESALSALPEPDKTAATIEWEYSQTVRRDRSFVATIGQALGLSESQIDDLFIAGNKL